MAGIGGLSRKGELDAVGLAVVIVLSSFFMIPGLLFIYFGARHLTRRNKIIAQALSVIRKTGKVSTALLAREMKLSEAFVVRISFRPCQRAADYDLPYSLPAPPKP